MIACLIFINDLHLNLIYFIYVCLMISLIISASEYVFHNIKRTLGERTENSIKNLFLCWSRWKIKKFFNISQRGLGE